MDGCDAAVTNEVCQGQCGVECGHHLITGYRLEIPLVSLVSVECGPDLYNWRSCDHELVSPGHYS